MPLAVEVNIFSTHIVRRKHCVSECDTVPEKHVI